MEHCAAAGKIHAQHLLYISALSVIACPEHPYKLSAELQRAKDLHPDLKDGFSAADGEAFLRLVAAYEVLSDPQQRQLYDITTNSRLPGSLKRAAAAAAAAADGGGSNGTEDGTGSDAGGRQLFPAAEISVYPRCVVACMHTTCSTSVALSSCTLRHER
jgi:hypothetical protein